MFGGANMVRQMQSRLAKMQDELSRETVEASAGGGAVKVVITGDQRLQSVTIDPAAVDSQDVDMLQDMVMAAVNEGLTKAQELAKKKMSAITGGLKIPGL